MMVGALVLPLTMRGMMDASTTRSPAGRARATGIHHVHGPGPHAAAAHGVVDGVGMRRMNCSISTSVCAAADEGSSRAPYRASAGCARISRMRRKPCTMRSMSARSPRKLGSTSGRSSGLLLARPRGPGSRAAAEQTWHGSHGRARSCAHGRPACRSQSAAARRAPAPDGWLRMKPPASAKLVVSMPVRQRAIPHPFQRLRQPGSDRPNRSVRWGASITCTTSGWSCRCAPRQADRAALRCLWRCSSAPGRCPRA